MTTEESAVFERARGVMAAARFLERFVDDEELARFARPSAT